MKTKFNKFERVAGLFVLTAIVGSLAAFVGIAVKKGWFEPKVKFETDLVSADGLRAGTLVQIAGLRAGTVTDVELKANNEVHVRFEISEKFHDRVRSDSVVRAIRPFIIGEKVLDISVGSDQATRIAAGGSVRSEATADIMDLVSGRTLGPYLESMGKMMESLRFLVEALLNPERSQSMIAMFDQMAPLLKNASTLTREANTMLKEVNRDKKLIKLVENIVVLTNETNKYLPMIAKDTPQLAEDMKKIAHNMAVMTDELQKLMPAIQQMGPEFPRASRRAIEALDETVVTLKALQKSFILRSNAREVREEEAARDALRAPAAEKNPKNGSP